MHTTVCVSEAEASTRNPLSNLFFYYLQNISVFYSAVNVLFLMNFFWWLGDSHYTELIIPVYAVKLLDPGKVLCRKHKCLVFSHTPACTETVLVIKKRIMKTWRAVYKNSERIKKSKHTCLTSSFNFGTSQGQTRWPEVKRETEMNVRSRILSTLEDYMTSGKKKYRLFLSGSGNAHAV